MKSALIIILFVGLFQSPSYADIIFSDQHLELVWVEAELGEDLFSGEGMNFFGEIRNTHDAYALQFIKVYVVLKKEGKVVGRYFSVVDRTALVTDSEDQMVLLPGSTASFRVRTSYLPDEYDEYYIRPEGSVARPHDLEVREIDYLEFDFGQIENWNTQTGFEYNILDDASIGFYEFETSDGKNFVYGLGELVNRTNADFAVLSIVLEIFDAEGKQIGWAARNYGRIYPTLSAYGKLDFVLDDIQWREGYTAASIGGWEVSQEYTELLPYRLVEEEPVEPEATVVETQTWGAIKAMHR